MNTALLLLALGGPWLSWSQAHERSQASGLPIVLMIGSANCRHTPAARALFESAAIRDPLNGRVVFAYEDLEGLAALTPPAPGATLTPSVVIVAPNGSELWRVPPNVSADRALAILERVLESELDFASQRAAFEAGTLTCADALTLAGAYRERGLAADADTLLDRILTGTASCPEPARHDASFTWALLPGDDREALERIRRHLGRYPDDLRMSLNVLFAEARTGGFTEPLARSIAGFLGRIAADRSDAAAQIREPALRLAYHAVLESGGAGARLLLPFQVASMARTACSETVLRRVAATASLTEDRGLRSSAHEAARRGCERTSGRWPAAAETAWKAGLGDAAEARRHRRDASRASTPRAN